MSCNGCRILRKGCSDVCVLRQCLSWIHSDDAQAYATVFVAKFYGRAAMAALISSVPELQRPALFQSLLYEACGRTINPVFGAVGLLSSGKWRLCEEAVATVLKGGFLFPSSGSSSSRMVLQPRQTHQSKVRLGRGLITTPALDAGDSSLLYKSRNSGFHSDGFSSSSRGTATAPEFSHFSLRKRRLECETSEALGNLMKQARSFDPGEEDGELVEAVPKNKESKPRQGVAFHDPSIHDPSIGIGIATRFGRERDENDSGPVVAESFSCKDELDLELTLGSSSSPSRKKAETDQLEIKRPLDVARPSRLGSISSSARNSTSCGSPRESSDSDTSYLSIAESTVAATSSPGSVKSDVLIAALDRLIGCGQAT